MAYQKADVADYVEIENAGRGGGTFIVLTAKGDLKVACFRLAGKAGRERGDRCALEAGYGTDHLGVGACKHHDTPSGTIRKLGRYSTVFSGHLRKRYHDYLTDTNVLDLSDELAVQRTVLSTAVEAAQNDELSDKDRVAWLKRMSETATEVATTVEKMVRVQAVQLVTWSLAQYMIARVVDVLLQSMQRFLMESGYASPETAELIARKFGHDFFVPDWKETIVGGSRSAQTVQRRMQQSERKWQENTIESEKVDADAVH